MRIVRFAYQNKQFWGVLGGDSIKILKFPPFEKILFANTKVLASKVKFLAPVTPSKIVLAGLNYSEHAKELNMNLPDEPLIFLKSPSALIGNGDSIIYPRSATKVEYEAELAIVIKKAAKSISEDEVGKYILGFTCLNDVTERSLQKKDIQWARAKSFDTFCPIGPWIETEIEASNLKIRSYLNGQVKQDSSTSNFIFPIPKAIIGIIIR